MFWVFRVKKNQKPLKSLNQSGIFYFTLGPESCFQIWGKMLALYAVVAQSWGWVTLSQMTKFTNLIPSHLIFLVHVGSLELWKNKNILHEVITLFSSNIMKSSGIPQVFNYKTLVALKNRIIVEPLQLINFSITMSFILMSCHLIKDIFVSFKSKIRLNSLIK